MGQIKELNGPQFAHAWIRARTGVKQRICSNAVVVIETLLVLTARCLKRKMKCCFFMNIITAGGSGTRRMPSEFKK